MKKNEIEVYDSRSLMVKIDPKTNDMEIVPRESQDIYRMCRNNTRKMSDTFNKYSNFDVNMNNKTMIKSHKVFMANNELKHFNDHCVLSTIEIVKKTLINQGLSLIDINKTGMLNIRSNISYLGGLNCMYDDIRRIFCILSDNVEYTNDESYSKYAEFTIISKINLYTERVSTDLYNNLVRLFYSMLIVYAPEIDVIKCVEDAVIDAILQFHDIYTYGLVDLIYKFCKEYGFELGKPLYDIPVV